MVLFKNPGSLGLKPLIEEPLDKDLALSKEGHKIFVTYVYVYDLI